jgi:formate dehydrogenase beta subunit
LSQHDKARDAALNMMRFFAHESCGQCTPCRVGTEKSAQLMRAAVWDQATLNDLSQVMVDASICGLGQAAPNPMQSVLKYFPHEVTSGGAA